MLKKEQLDPLLSDKFFTPPTAPQAVTVESQNENNHFTSAHVEIPNDFPFPLPSNKETIFHFMKLHGIEFTEGASDLINRLLAWTKKHDISFDAYKIFKREFNYKRYILDKSVYEDYLQEDCFDLFTEGLIALKKIVDQLESEGCPEHAPIVIAKMVLGLSACAPGMNVRIQTAFNELNPNPAQMLMAIRVEIVNQVVGEIIARNKDDFYVDAIMEVHYGTGVGNYYSQQLGIPFVNDENAPEGGYTIQSLIDLFPDELYKTLTAETVFNQLFLTSSFGFDKLLVDLPQNILEKGYIGRLEKKLNQYGPDEFYSLNAFFDQDALSDGEFKLDKFANETLRFSLLRRLIASGFFNIKFETYKLQEGSTVFFCPQRELPFSFILTPDGQSHSLERRCKEEVDKGKFTLCQFLSNENQYLFLIQLYEKLHCGLSAISKKSLAQKPVFIQLLQKVLSEPVFLSHLKSQSPLFYNLMVTLEPSLVLSILDEMGGPQKLNDSVGLLLAHYCVLLPSDKFDEYVSKQDFLDLFAKQNLKIFLHDYFSLGAITFKKNTLIFPLLKQARQISHIGEIILLFSAIPPENRQLFLEVLNGEFICQLLKKDPSKKEYFCKFLKFYITALEQNPNNASHDDLNFQINAFLKLLRQYEVATLCKIFSSVSIFNTLFSMLDNAFFIPFLNLFPGEHLRSIFDSPEAFCELKKRFPSSEANEQLAQRFGFDYLTKVYDQDPSFDNKVWRFVSISEEKRFDFLKSLDSKAIRDLSFAQLNSLLCGIPRQNLREACEWVGIEHIYKLIADEARLILFNPTACTKSELFFLTPDQELHLEVMLVVLTSIYKQLSVDNTATISEEELEAFEIILNIFENKLPVGCFELYRPVCELLYKDEYYWTPFQRLYHHVLKPSLQKKMAVQQLFETNHAILINSIKNLAATTDVIQIKAQIKHITSLIRFPDAKLGLKHFPRRFFQLLSSLSGEKVLAIFNELKMSFAALKENFGLSLVHYLVLLNPKDWFSFLSKEDLTNYLAESGLIPFWKDFYREPVDPVLDYYKRTRGERFSDAELKKTNILFFINQTLLEKEICSFQKLLEALAAVSPPFCSMIICVLTANHLAKLFQSAKDDLALKDLSFRDLLSKLWEVITKDQLKHVLTKLPVDYIISQAQSASELCESMEYIFLDEEREDFLCSFPAEYLQSIINSLDDLRRLWCSNSFLKLGRLLTLQHLVMIAKKQDTIDANNGSLVLQWLLVLTPVENRFLFLKSLMSKTDSENSIPWAHSCVYESLSRINSLLLLFPKNDLSKVYEFLNEPIDGKKPITALIFQRIQEKMTLKSGFLWATTLSPEKVDLLNFSYQLLFLRKDHQLWRKVAIEVLELYIHRDTSKDKFVFFKAENNAEVIAVKALLRVLRNQQPLMHLEDPKYQAGIEKVANIIEFEDFIKPLLDRQKMELEKVASQSTGMRLSNQN